MNNIYESAMQKIECDTKNCRLGTVFVGPTARCNKSSIYIFKW